MIPGNYPLKLYHGDSYHWQFKLWLDSGKTQPADLSEATAKAQIRDRAGGEKVFDLICDISQPNVIDVTLDAPQSELLPPNANMRWDLQLTYTSGAVNTIVAGPVSITADITA